MLWYHSIDLGQGVTTKGLSENRVEPAELPDFNGKSVLDIGAWDGRYSFMAEKAGARRVLALDHYAWCVDFGGRQAYWQECREKGELPNLDRDLVDFWLPDAPGKRGFNLAHEALDSNVESQIGDFMTMDLDELKGPFDIVLFLGVLYHLKEPLRALERLRTLTTDVLVVETEAVRIEGYDNANLLLFCPGDEFGQDYSDWFITTETALHGLLRAAGFRRSVTKRQHALPDLQRRLHIPGVPSLVPAVRPYRLVVHAFA